MAEATEVFRVQPEGERLLVGLRAPMFNRRTQVARLASLADAHHVYNAVADAVILLDFISV